MNEAGETKDHPHSWKRSTRLLALSHFEHVFRPLCGKRVGLVDGVGKNVGDRLIYAATRQLLDSFEIDWVTQHPRRRTDVEILLLFGGGNLGSKYRREIRIRRTALKLDVPAIVLPQSCMGPERGPFQRVYVREHYSLRFFPDAVLAPDLALGYDMALADVAPHRARGMFLRNDSEAKFGDTASDERPTEVCRTPEEYITYASGFGCIATDMLHFAICGLMAGRRVILLPNTYHKNRGMWETWLRRLGCEWANTPAEALVRLPE